MIKLMHILKEAFSDEFGKKRWAELDHQHVINYGQQIVDLINTAYASKGGNLEIKSLDDLKKTDLTFWLAIDLDTDPDTDAVVAGKPTPAGVKMTMMGQDGSGDAKRSVVTKMISLMKTRGFYAEMDKDLAAKFNLPYIKDESEIRAVLRKDLKMNPDGSYDRKLTAGPVKTKVLVGIPKIM